MTKNQVQKRLDKVRYELLVATSRGEIATELRLKAAHLSAAVRYWINGISEKKFV